MQPTGAAKSVQLSWQNIPYEILVSFLELLVHDHNERYAILNCSHVCSHWRVVICDAPSLWSFIDTARGDSCNDLWLSRSGQSQIHLYLWEYPLHSRRVSEIERAKHHIARCKTLDIRYSCICLTTLALTSLGEINEALHLDSLTIGPTARTAMLIDDGTLPADSWSGTRCSTRVTKRAFAGLKLLPTTLYIDTYPVGPSGVFSTRLSVLEVSVGAYMSHTPNGAEWRSILLAAPNLAIVKLWHSVYPQLTDSPLADFASPQHLTPIHLGSLKRLELFGMFVILTDLFCESTLSSLQSLRLDSYGPANIPNKLVQFASVSPNLCDLIISFDHTIRGDFESWETGTKLSALRSVTFVEMEWWLIAELLVMLAVPRRIQITLERIWDLNSSTAKLGDFIGDVRFEFTLVDCIEEGGTEDNYSDRSSFGYDYSSDSDSDEFASGDNSTTSNSAESTFNGNSSGTSDENNDAQGSQDRRNNEGAEESRIQPEEDDITDSEYDDSDGSSYCSKCGKTCETLEDDAYSLASGDLEILNNLASEVHNTHPGSIYRRAN
ncbi:hypothetical protein BDV93DRAFT_521329 [Ceratobasidium sp. AG-I]|nr:hypothetical protein BDV93DRAFT_521329 [Ceratobasidium sp. AG-I]